MQTTSSHYVQFNCPKLGHFSSQKVFYLIQFSPKKSSQVSETFSPHGMKIIHVHHSFFSKDPYQFFYVNINSQTFSLLYFHSHFVRSVCGHFSIGLTVCHLILSTTIFKVIKKFQFQRLFAQNLCEKENTSDVSRPEIFRH